MSHSSTAGYIPISGAAEQTEDAADSAHSPWPQSWQDASSWAARIPTVAGSLTGSFIRTRHPEILDHEQDVRSPHIRRAVCSQQLSTDRDDLEEALIFEFDEQSASQTAGAGAAADQQLETASSVISAVSPSLSHIRSVTKDATGTHIETDTFTMHIQEELSTSNTWQAAFNAINILCGVGLLTTPYAMAITGLSSLLLLIAIGAIACYTGRLLAKCMNSSRSIKTYPDIGQAAFGPAGRLLVSVLLYLELFSCCVDFLILEGDNLSAVFPAAGVVVGGYRLTAKETLILLAALLVLPTVWLRDLSLLSFLSVGGIFASLALLFLVGWEGVAVTGFTHARPPLVTWPGVPVSIGIFCFCFSGHAVFPSLYASMRSKQHFPWLLVGSFSIVVLLYGAMAILGSLMYGSAVSENITLDMQNSAPTAMPTVLAMWLVIVNPVAKIALTLAPVAMAVEELLMLKRGTWRFTAASITLRTALLGTVACVAVAVPFFSAVMSFIGAFMSMSISIVLPCIFYMRICTRDLSAVDRTLSIAIAIFGTVAGFMATYNAVTGIAGKY